MVVAHPADRQMDCSEALRDCPVPLLYLAGSKDAIVTRRSLEQILAVRLDISVATLDGPHLLLQESPEEAARIIERFVRACTLDPPDQ
jgi:surfactin synthase thioesterase subunit